MELVRLSLPSWIKEWLLANMWLVFLVLSRTPFNFDYNRAQMKEIILL